MRKKSVHKGLHGAVRQKRLYYYRNKKSEMFESFLR